MKHFHLLFFCLLLVGMAGCNGSGERFDDDGGGDTLTFHASLLTIIDYGGWVDVTVSDPWKEGVSLARYALVHRDSVMPDSLPAGSAVVRVPLRRTIVYSSVHTSPIVEMGAVGAVAGVADARYFPQGDTIAALVDSGRIADIGSSMQPSMERVLELEPDAILLSPYENAGHGEIALASAPLIECADYMESTPIGRAEWILLLGELYGRRAEARAILDGVIERYGELAYKVGLSKIARPKVITEMPQSGVWYVPAGGSYMSRMLTDAGGINPWAEDGGAGSVQLDASAVLAKAEDADVWLLRTFGFDVRPSSLTDATPLAREFKAFKDGNIYGCNTAVAPIYNDIAFHPERILADYVAIFHPDVMDGYELRYYKKAD